MKKVLVKLTGIILAIGTLFSVFSVPVQAAPKSISDKSSNSVTFTVYTKASWKEFYNSYPAKITLTQTKGTCVYTDVNGRKKTSVNNGYCYYDISYVVYDCKTGKRVLSGSDSFYGAKKTIYLKAGCTREYKYVVTIKPHYGYVWNKYTKKYYLGYVWTKPCTWTVKPDHDITGIYKGKVTKMK